MDVHATDNGTFTLVFDIFDANGSSLQSFVFSGVPISAHSGGELLFDPSAAEQELNLDVNGDGRVDYVIPANQPPPVASFVSVLMDIVDGFAVPQGTSTALQSTLAACLSDLNRGNRTAGKGTLNAFANKVRAMNGKELTDGQAQLLLSLTNKAIGLL